ncbi:MAG: nucleotidyltransferase [Nitrospirae bacterium]|jgi:hypothetical protein|nr:nucleotidyltransferase [Nitrospirota bacterium]
MFEEIISKIASKLKDHNIPYMIIDGQAVLLYGEPRLTRDIDITLGVNIDSLEEILSIVNELSLKPVPQDVKSFVSQTMVLPVLDEPSGIRIDFIFSFTPYETEAIKRARTISLMGKEVAFASPEDVIIHKIFAGRPRDLEDARTIILKNPNIDIRYIENWLKEFDSSISDKDFLKTFQAVFKKAL